MLIKHKLVGLSALSVISLLIVLLASWWTWLQLERLASAGQLTAQLTSRILKVERHGQDFFFQHAERDAVELREHLRALDQDIARLAGLLGQDAIPATQFDALRQEIAQYQERFEQFSMSPRRSGLITSPDSTAACARRCTTPRPASRRQGATTCWPESCNCVAMKRTSC